MRHDNAIMMSSLLSMRLRRRVRSGICSLSSPSSLQLLSLSSALRKNYTRRCRPSREVHEHVVDAVVVGGTNSTSSFTSSFSSFTLHRRCCHRMQYHHHRDRCFSSMLPSSSSSSNQQQHAVPNTTTTNSTTTTTTTTTLADDHHFLLPQEQLLLYAPPIDFTTQSQISGSESQILEIQLRPNQILRAESGAMLYMSQGITMETSMGVVGASSSSSPSTSSMFATGFTRLMTGQNLMISDFRYVPQPISTTTTTTTPTTINTDENDIHGGGADYSTTSGTIGLGTDFPAKILKFDLSSYPSHKLICQKGAYLAGSYGVTMDMAYVKSFAGGFFGGEGFILQCLQAGEIPSGRVTLTIPPKRFSMSSLGFVRAPLTTW